MDEAALLISIVALVLALVVAGFAILLQFLLYRASSKQTDQVADSLASFKTDLQSMISRLQGQTDTMAGIQRDQFNTMLDAFVRRPETTAEAAEKASQSALASYEVIEGLESLEEKMAESPQLVQTLPDEVRELKRRIDRMADVASAAASLSAQAGVGYNMHQYWVPGFGGPRSDYGVFAIDVVHLLEEVKSRNAAREPASPLALEKWHQAEVMEPQAALDMAVREGLINEDYDENSDRAELLVTDKGDRLLQIIRGARRRGLVP